MAKFQIVNMKKLEGNAKASGRPYKMLIVAGLFTGDDGVVEMGEVSFMERENYPIPTHLVPGQTYAPTIAASARDGKLQFQISELKALNASVKSA